MKNGGDASNLPLYGGQIEKEKRKKIRREKREKRSRNVERGGEEGGSGIKPSACIICMVPWHRCHQAEGLSIHFIRNVFAITLRRRSHGLSNGSRGPRERPRNAMCVQHKWPSANINNRHGKYMVRRYLAPLPLSYHRRFSSSRAARSRYILVPPWRAASGDRGIVRGDPSRDTCYVYGAPLETVQRNGAIIAG